MRGLVKENVFKFISKEEAEMINGGRKKVDKEARKRLKVPYKKIALAPASVACSLSSVALNWGILCLVFYLPMYFRLVL